MSELNGRTHHYHAEATILSGHLRLPLEHHIQPQAHTHLPKEGGYFSHRAERFLLESVISFRSAYTHVAGNINPKPGGGWTTLATTVIEGLNVMEVVTADRIVGQTITEHPVEGYVPTVNFLGTRFENLRIAGFPVDLDLNLNFLGPKPPNDAAYTRDPGLIGRISGQLGRVGEHPDLPAELHQRYNQLSASLGSRPEEVECSLVNRVSGAYPGRSFGHVITIPDFGTIILGKVIVKHEDFKTETGAPKKTTIRLTMIDFHFGCAIAGSAGTGDGSSNGTTEP
ncbi:MAG: hypothetical protein ACLQDA_07235 [Terracidiphilus sp.]